MKKRLICLLLLPFLLLPLCLPVRADTGQDLLDRMDDILRQIESSGLEYDGASREELLRRGLDRLFEEDPQSFDRLMDAILSGLDDHSMYIPAGAYQQVFAETDAYVGIGVTLEPAGDQIRIAAVESDGPAHRAGLCPGDILLCADGTDLSGLLPEDAAQLLRGSAGTAVELTVRRGSAQLAFRVTRENIVLPNLTGRVLEDGVYYMSLRRFAGSGTYAAFSACMDALEANGCRVLILDLRGNPGGELTMALYFLNRLIPDPDVDYFMISGRPDGLDSSVRIYRSSGIGPRLDRMILLTDGGSASAAEVMISSLHDLGCAVTVGQTTYGKARGQQHTVYDDGGAAVLTTVRLVPPSGADYEGIGLTPDYVVENYTAPHPAAACRRLDFRYLAQGDRGTRADTLRAALQALGYLDAGCREQAFGRETLAALDAFRQDQGLQPLPYLNAETANRLNDCLDALAPMTVTVDAQLAQALSLARQALQ